MSADRIRALADSGTPGPWQAGHHLVLRTEVVPEIIASATQLGGPIDQTRNEADAAKIVAAVNALPKVAALVAVIERAHAGADAWGTCHQEWLRINELRAAADDVLAGLGVDSE